jgi:hypothetical protein
MYVSLIWKYFAVSTSHEIKNTNQVVSYGMFVTQIYMEPSIYNMYVS